MRSKGFRTPGWELLGVIDEGVDVDMNGGLSVILGKVVTDEAVNGMLGCS